jgi:hypothetical protein
MCRDTTVVIIIKSGFQIVHHVDAWYFPAPDSSSAGVLRCTTLFCRPVEVRLCSEAASIGEF